MTVPDIGRVAIKVHLKTGLFSKNRIVAITLTSADGALGIDGLYENPSA